MRIPKSGHLPAGRAVDLGTHVHLRTGRAVGLEIRQVVDGRRSIESRNPDVEREVVALSRPIEQEPHEDRCSAGVRTEIAVFVDEVTLQPSVLGAEGRVRPQSRASNRADRPHVALRGTKSIGSSSGSTTADDGTSGA